MLKVASPLLRVAAAEAYLPLVSLTVPAGMGSPVGAATVTVAVSGCKAVMPVEESVIFAVGTNVATLTDAEAETLPNVVVSAVLGV